MTTEQAINVLSANQSTIKDKDFKESVNTALKALKMQKQMEHRLNYICTRKVSSSLGLMLENDILTRFLEDD